jgi:hypothetical protein
MAVVDLQSTPLNFGSVIRFTPSLFQPTLSLRQNSWPNSTNIHKESISVAEDGFLFICFASMRLQIPC